MRRFGSSRRPASCTTTLAMRGRPVRCTLMNEILLRPPTIYRVLGSWQPPLPSPSHPLPLYPLPHPILPTLALPGACPPTACPSGPCCCRWLAGASLFALSASRYVGSARSASVCRSCLSVRSARPFPGLCLGPCAVVGSCVCVSDPRCVCCLFVILSCNAPFSTHNRTFGICFSSCRTRSFDPYQDLSKSVSKSACARSARKFPRNMPVSC